MTPNENTQAEREAFETLPEFAADPALLERNSKGEYFYTRVRGLWEGWQARAALAASPSCEQSAAHAAAGAEEDAYVIGRLSSLLAGVAIALKGEELPLHRHSYHDLVELAQTLKLELDLYHAVFPNGVPESVIVSPDDQPPPNETIAAILRDACESEPADPTDLDTICISRDYLQSILAQHLAATPSPEALPAMQEGEYPPLPEHDPVPFNAGCTQALRVAGKAYPRTCAACKLGPCKFFKATARAAPAAASGAEELPAVALRRVVDHWRTMGAGLEFDVILERAAKSLLIPAAPTGSESGDALDARRYRWLREQSHPWGSRWLSLEPLDAAIDAALQSSQPNKGVSHG